MGTIGAHSLLVVLFPPPHEPRLRSRARPVTGQQPLRSARRAPNPRAQVDSAGPRPALSAGPTPPRPPGRSAVPSPGAGRERAQNHRQPGRLPPERSELSTRRRGEPGRPGAGIYLGESASESKRRPRPRWRETIIRAGRGGGYGSSSVSSVRGTCRAGGRPAAKTNRCFFFLLLLLLPHRNTHKHPTGARATGGASPRAREPILLPAGASLPAAWRCRNKMPTGSAAAGMTPSAGAKH
ncbi:PREDICTED: translation initiation factor IF-2-like [Chinchilla lanigera]|uniref:translation initiation factor IF-2-like n=1 Tax=Chinchilla lanigera TaxID=34839 RepID=UPI00038F08E1|nr:PREDICTED: translation initiation factor IF-2-like [Chinchilla lanigera]